MVPKDTKLMGLHLFYKNDLPEGFGVGLDEQFFIDDPKVEQMFCDASQMSINEFKKWKTDKEREQFIAGIQEQFAQCCRWMNQHKGQPMDEEWVSCFVILLDDMTFLQSLGLFPNNEYNGPQWVWFNR